MAVRVAMVAGETSGDLLASHLIKALRTQCPELACEGIGGPKMEAAGFDALWQSERLAVHGYVDALRRYRELSRIRKALLKRLLADPPDVFIGVDAPDFSLWLESRLRARGIPTIHFVSPSIWAWRGGRITHIRAAVDRMLCLLPFELEIYEAAGVPASYVGHPLADVLPLVPDRAAARERLQLRESTPVFALLPGSRQSEVRNLAPLFIQAALRLKDKYPEARFLVPLATRETHEIFDQAMYHAELDGTSFHRMFGHAVDALFAPEESPDETVQVVGVLHREPVREARDLDRDLGGEVVEEVGRRCRFGRQRDGLAGSGVAQAPDGHYLSHGRLAVQSHEAHGLSALGRIAQHPVPRDGGAGIPSGRCDP